MTKIKVSKEYGRGVYATGLIEPGQVIMVCELLVLCSKDTVFVNETDLQYYTFKYSDNQDCIVLGDGEIFNHDNNPNVSYHLEMIDGRNQMVFKALRYIERDEQLFIDYSADTTVDTKKYIENVSLVG